MCWTLTPLLPIKTYMHYGYLTQGHKEMLQRIFKTANRRGFTVREYDLEELAENAQYDLFHNSCSTDHCLNHSYTANRKPAGSMQLRHRGHSFALRNTIHLEFNKTLRRSCIVWLCLMCVTCLFYNIILDLFLIHFNQYNSLFVCLICDVLIM